MSRDDSRSEGLPGHDPHDDLPGGERLQKVMAAAGVASRRVSEDMIAAGRVRVNGRVVTEPGRRIDPEADEVEVDGTVVQLDATKRYVMLNKPVGVVSSLSDEHGRADLRQYAEQYDERLFNVGRLDAETSGLLLLTNDGRLAHVLAHPSFGVTKTYVAKVRGQVTRDVLAQLQSGVELEDGPIAADRARLVGGGAGLSRSGDSSLVEITLHSGRNRIVRRMMEAVGHPVVDLVRRQFGPLHLGTLKVGHLRALTRDELGAVLTVARQGGEDVTETEADAADRDAVDESSVVDVDLDAEKDFYDEDDAEYDPATDARDESRRGRTTAGGAGRPGDQGRDRGSRDGGPTSRRSEVRRQQAGRRERGRDDDRGRDDRGREDRGRDDRGREDRGRGGWSQDRRPSQRPPYDRSRDDRGRDDRGRGSWSDDRRDDRRRDDRGRDGGDRRPAPGRPPVERGGSSSGRPPFRGGAARRDAEGFRRDDRGARQDGDDRGARRPGPERGAPRGPFRGGSSRRDADGFRRDDRGAREDGAARGGNDRGGFRGGSDRRDDRGGHRGGPDRRDDRGGRGPRGGDRP